MHPNGYTSKNGYHRSLILEALRKIINNYSASDRLRYKWAILEFGLAYSRYLLPSRL